MSIHLSTLRTDQTYPSILDTKSQYHNQTNINPTSHNQHKHNTLLKIINNNLMVPKRKVVSNKDEIPPSPALPVSHPTNELDIPDLSLLSTEYSTCNLFVNGYIRQYSNNINIKTLEFINKIIENYSFKSLRIKSNTKMELYPKTEYFYNYIILEENAILTSRNQGILAIICFDMILHKGSKIHLNGKGYHGGLPTCQGGSYLGSSGVFTVLKDSNYGGGGGGILFGGGAGYGSKGVSGDQTYVYKSGDGGISYGDSSELDYNNNFNHFYMGSGGGGGYNDGKKKIAKMFVRGNNIRKKRSSYHNQNMSLAITSKGGDGGGALYLNIFGYLHLYSNTSIECNGQDGYAGIDCGGGGGGSGGSILIDLYKYDNLIMNDNSYIKCIGGCGATKQCGNGGYGRIRIKNNKWNQVFTKSVHKNINLKSITPKPYIG